MKKALQSLKGLCIILLLLHKKYKKYHQLFLYGSIQLDLSVVITSASMCQFSHTHTIPSD